MRLLAASLLAALAGHASAAVLSSPDGRISVNVHAGAQGGLAYAIARDGQPVLLDSDLGLQLDGADLATRLKLQSISPVRAVSEDYRAPPSRRDAVRYRANEQTYVVRNPQRQRMDIVFRVSNDGVAFRYVVADPSLPHKRLRQERTTFAFDAAARAWLQPVSGAQARWNSTHRPSGKYDRVDMPTGTPSPSPAGWVFLALLNSGAHWVAISEAGMASSFRASLLAPAAATGTYAIGDPMPAEIRRNNAVVAATDGELVSPWRILALGAMPAFPNDKLAKPASPDRPVIACCARRRPPFASSDIKTKIGVVKNVIG